MKKTAISIMTLILFLTLVISPASASGQEVNGLDITLDVTYATQYLWRGYDLFSDNPAIQPSVELGYGSFYAGVWASLPMQRGSEDLTEVDFYAGYGFSLAEGTAGQVDLDLNYTYFDYPKTGSEGDVQEVGLNLSMPSLIPLGPSNLVPSLTVFYDWDGIQSSEHVDNGWFYIFALGYDIPVPALLDYQEHQAISLGWEITYADGPYGTDADWTHCTFTVSTSFEGEHFYLAPSVNYQVSFEDDVNEENELYGLLSLGYAF